MRLGAILGVGLAMAAGCRKEPVVPPADFASAVAYLEKRTGARAGPLVGYGPEDEEQPIPEGRSFDVEEAEADELLKDLHAPWKKAGLYLFRYDRSFGIGGQKDKVALLPTRDPYGILLKMGTNGTNYGKSTEDVIRFLRELEREVPFDLTEIGIDYVEGRFLESPRDPIGLAQRLYEFCPDIVEQGVPMEDLPRILSHDRVLYLWWD